MFCLHFNRSGKGPAWSSDEVLKALDPYGVADSQHHCQQERLDAFHVGYQNSPASQRESFPFKLPNSEVLIFAWARLDNRLELAGKLGISAADLSSLSDPQLILRTWARWQRSCTDHLVGDFAFVIYDPLSNQLFCARDHLGVRPLYYLIDQQQAVISTSLPPILLAAGRSFMPDQQWLARYLTGTSMDNEETAWQGIVKLPPGHQLVVSQKNLECRSYFDLSSLGAEPEAPYRRVEDCLDAYRQQFIEAVVCRTVSEYPVGSELSGGLDSASITSMAARELQGRGETLDVFSVATFELEAVFAEAVCKRWGLSRQHRISRFSPAQLHADLERAPLLLGCPAEHSSATFHESFYQQAERVHVRTLLSGFGGDEFVTSPAGLGLVARELLRDKRFGELWRRLPGGWLLRLRRLMGILRRQHRQEMSALERRIRQQFQHCWENQLIRPEVARRYQLEERYFAPVRFDSDYDSLRDYILKARWQPASTTRLENCSLMARSHNIEYRWPLLDIRLVRLFMNLPVELTYDRGMDRNLHRLAVKDVVPEVILKQPGKDVGPLRPIPDHINSICHYRQESSLHPLILECIDESAYREQCQQLARGFRALGIDQWLQLFQNVHAVSQANCWLLGRC